MFDSGLGGLSVAREIRRALPAVDVRYAADNRYCPYGSRSPAEILERALAMVGALVERGVALVVIACNTATAVAVEAARARFSLPIIGVEPAVKPAVVISATRKIAVLATPRTAESERLARLIQRFGGDAEVVPVAAPTWVELVEAGVTDGPRARAAVAPVVAPLLERGVDTLVLGCTHFPFLRAAITDIAGPGVAIIDSGEAIARHTRALLGAQPRSSHTNGRLDLHTTGEPARVGRVAARLLGEEVTARHRLAESPVYPAAASPKLSAECTDSTSARL